jgi:hypothetical protein
MNVALSDKHREREFVSFRKPQLSANDTEWLSEPTADYNGGRDEADLGR